MITIPDWLVLTCAVVGALFILNVIIVAPIAILASIEQRRERRRDAAVRRAGAELAVAAERIANGLPS